LLLPCATRPEGRQNNLFAATGRLTGSRISRLPLINGGIHFRSGGFCEPAFPVDGQLAGKDHGNRSAHETDDWNLV
jgi:hypothetical protein